MNQTLFKKSPLIVFASLMLITLGLMMAAVVGLNQIKSSKGPEELALFKEALEDLAQKKALITINKKLTRGEVDKAFDEWKKVDSSLKEWTEKLEITSYKPLQRTLDKYQRVIQDSTALSKPADILHVLGNKVERFHDWSNEKRWKNLERISDRMLNRVIQAREEDELSSNSLRFLLADFSSLKLVSVSAALKGPEKMQIQSVLEGWDGEITMLGRYRQNAVQLATLFDEAQKQMDTWVKEAKESMQNRELLHQERFNLWIRFLWGSMLLLCLVLASAIYYSILFKREQQNYWSHWIKQFIDKRNASLDFFRPDQKEKIQKSIQQMSEKEKLSYDFQYALPVSTLFMNKEGKVIWANPLFCEQFYVNSQDVREGRIHWDELTTFLSFEEKDLLNQVLKEKESRIVQVRQHLGENISLPFEVTLSPVCDSDKNPYGLLLVFYPLVAMEEAIKTQSEMLFDPIREFIHCLETDSLGVVEEANLEKKFNTIEQDDIFKRMVRWHEARKSEVHGLLVSLQATEHENKDFIKFITDAQKTVSSLKNSIRKDLQQMKNIKNILIEMGMNAEGMVEVNIGLIDIINDQEAKIKSHEARYQASVQIAEEMSTALKQLIQMKSEVKVHRGQLLDLKNKMISSHNTFLSQAQELTEIEMSRALKVKDDLGLFSDTLAGLDKKLTQWDLHLAKLEMILANMNVIPAWQDWSKAPFSLELHLNEIKELKLTIAEDEEMVVETMKELYQELSGELQQIKILEEHLSEIALPVQIRDELESPNNLL